MLVRHFDNGTFARLRLRPEDPRDVLVRRGDERRDESFLGTVLARREVLVDGRLVPLVTFRARLSPPPLGPGQPPLPPDAARRFQPVSDVVFLPDAQVLIPRGPGGFDDAEVLLILDSLSLACTD